METLLEHPEKAEHDLDFLRDDLLAANKSASREAPFAAMAIAELLKMQAEIEVKLSQLIVIAREQR